MEQTAHLLSEAHVIILDSVNSIKNTDGLPEDYLDYLLQNYTVKFDQLKVANFGILHILFEHVFQIINVKLVVV